MFFIYLFFAIGLVCTLVALIPAGTEAYAYVRAYIITFKEECDARLEARKEKINTKKKFKLEAKLAKLQKDTAVIEAEEKAVDEKIASIEVEPEDAIEVVAEENTVETKADAETITKQILSEINL